MVTKIRMEGVREYGEQMPVYLDEYKGRLTVSAFNEGGFNGTDVDILDLLEWIKSNMPELLEDD